MVFFYIKYFKQNVMKVLKSVSGNWTIDKWYLEMKTLLLHLMTDQHKKLIP